MLISVAAFGQSPLSVDEAVAIAVKDHPLLQTSQDRIAVTEGYRRQAELRLNPRLILQSENTTPRSGFSYSQDTDNFAYLQQTIETAHKRDLRIAAAGANVERARLEKELLQRQIAARVRQAYWFAVGAKRAEDLLRDNLSTFQRIIEYHVIRVKEGAMAEADLIRVRLEGERLSASLNTSILDSERARIHLQREMGRVEFPPVQLTGTLDASATPREPFDLAAAVERRLEMKIARHAVQQAVANRNVQEAAAKPNFDLVFGYKRASGYNAAYNTMLGGIQMDLPFANKNQGNIAATTAEVRFAESTAAATAALIRAEAEAANREYEMRRRQLGGSLLTMQQQAEETARIAEAAYREGGADLLRLLDAQRLRIDTQLFYSRALAEYRQSIVALETAMGVAP
ncbi:MAG: TolC family protein [Acidobacteria bacterium]|nr:TolC family protein [Acidobacteriota bacterium]